MRKILIFISTVFLLNISVFAQWAPLIQQFDTLLYDTLQYYPFIYCYNWPDTAHYHDTTLCTKEEVDVLVAGYDYATWQSRSVHEFAVYQHTDVPLNVTGFAFAAINGNYAELKLYDSAMNVIISDTMLCWDQHAWYTTMDSSRWKILTLPGKTIRVHDVSPFTEKICLNILRFDAKKSVTVTDGFWIGITYYSDSEDRLYLNPRFVFERHDTPYDITNVRYRMLENGIWVDDTMEGSIPELFVLIEPECQSVEGLTVTEDTSGCIDVVWDSAAGQSQWQVFLHGPGVSLTDTVDACHWHYCVYDTSEVYTVTVSARCYKPHHNVWSEWCEPVTVGNTQHGSIDAAEAEQFTLSPNPAAGQVTVSASQGIKQIEVYDTRGAKIYSQTMATDRWTLTTEEWPAGQYIVTVETAAGTTSKVLSLVK